MPVFRQSNPQHLRRKLLGTTDLPIVPSLAGKSPFSWAVYDSLFPAAMVSRAASEFPAPDWPGWHRYDSPGEKKLVSIVEPPPACRELLDAMDALCPSELSTDPNRYAAGLNATPPGGWLDLHRDATHHAKTGLRRAVNLILFLDDWKPEWGGALEFHNEHECEVSVMPAKGRAVAFDCSDAIHGVPEPTNPFGSWRRSLAVFWYEHDTIRPRAEFLAHPSETADFSKEKWRRQRSA